MAFCIECGREVRLREEDSFVGAEFPGGILCRHCYDRRSEMERRANREWFVALWEDGPWWVKAVLILVVPVGFLIVFAAEGWGVGWIYSGYMKYLEAVEHFLRMLGLDRSLAAFLALISPILLTLLLGLLRYSSSLVGRSFRS